MHISNLGQVRMKERNPQQEAETEPEPEPETRDPEPEPDQNRTLSQNRRLYLRRILTSKKAQKRNSYYSSLPPQIEYAKSIYVRSPYKRRWSQFRRLRFVGDEATISLNPDLLAHAKICAEVIKIL